MEEQKERLLETLTEPDYIQKGDFGEFLAIRYYKSTLLDSKFLVVVYKEIDELDGFVVTAYFTNKFSDSREMLWKR